MIFLCKDVPTDEPVCNVDDWVYRHGDSMEILKDFDGNSIAECHQCTCKSGKLEDCHRIFYCKPDCKNSIRIPGQCCPTCVNRGKCLAEVIIRTVCIL